ncbi:MAG: hypothetical protein WC428_07245 [Candidatus Paceibacterota bacterium]
MEEPFILEDEYPVGEKGKVRVIFEFYLKEQFKDLEVDNEKILEGLKDLLGDMPTGICTNVAASIIVLPIDFELSKRLIDVVNMDAKEEVPIVAEDVPFARDKKEQERDFLVAYR